MNERQRHRETAIDVGLLRRDPAEVVEPRQAAMLHDEIQILERGRDVVDIGDVESVAIERDDRRTLVNVDVLDAELLRGLEE